MYKSENEKEIMDLGVLDDKGMEEANGDQSKNKEDRVGIWMELSIWLCGYILKDREGGS